MALIVGIPVIWLILQEMHLLPSPPPNWEDAEQRARALCEQNNLPYPPPNRKMVVYKRARKLQLYSGELLLAEFPVALSPNPVGTKHREGDRKVPEGDYYICEKHRSRRFHLFMGLSYPSIPDADRGLRQGLITPAQAQTIRSAIQSGQCPPWNTPLGGAIGLHGGGTGRDWTLGCIALSDHDIEVLYLLMSVGDPVRILP